MQASLTFHLPEDEHEFLCAVHGVLAVRVSREIDDRLRALLKHGEINKTSSKTLAEEIRGELREILALVEE